MSALRFAVIGTGRIAGDYLRALEALPDLQLVAVADLREELALAVGERWSVPAYRGLPELLAVHELDAVLIAVPPLAHEALSIAALEAGLHVLCEKPFALDSASARRMQAVAQKVDRVLTMSAKFRHVPDVIEAKTRLAAGAIGVPLMLRQVFGGVVPMAGRWNADAELSGGGVWIDNGTHSVDLLRYLLGPVLWVQAAQLRSLQELEVEDSIRVMLGFADDVVASVDLSWSLPATEPYYLEVFGSLGSLHLGWASSLLRLDGNARHVEIGAGYDKLIALGRQLAQFARAARGEEPASMDTQDVLASVAVIEAGYASLRADGARCWVEA